jgi:predicted nucleic acid-binding protein
VRPNPDPNVVSWVRATDESRLYLSVLTFGEIRRGIEALPSGRRRDRLRRWLEVDLTDRFEGRILMVDRRVAELWGIIMARAAEAGMQLPSIDTLIAATAEHHGMVVATRNTRDFAHATIAAVDPWTAADGPRP